MITKTRWYHPILQARQYLKILVTAIRTPLLLFFMIVGNAVTFACAYLFFHFEKPVNNQVNTLFDGIWWSFATVSTVGFGDIAPITTEGRLVGMFLMVTGVILFVGFTAILVSVVIELTEQELAKNSQLSQNEKTWIINDMQMMLDEIKRKLKNN